MSSLRQAIETMAEAHGFIGDWLSLLEQLYSELIRLRGLAEGAETELEQINQRRTR